MAVTLDGLRCQSREQKEWHGCRANKGVSGSGKYFFEATVTDEGLCRVGWSTSQASVFITIIILNLFIIIYFYLLGKILYNRKDLRILFLE